MAITALAGPVSNIFVAVAAMILYYGIATLLLLLAIPEGVSAFIRYIGIFFYYIADINI